MYQTEKEKERPSQFIFSTIIHFVRFSLGTWLDGFKFKTSICEALKCILACMRMVYLLKK